MLLNHFGIELYHKCNIRHAYRTLHVFLTLHSAATFVVTGPTVDVWCCFTIPLRWNEFFWQRCTLYRPQTAVSLLEVNAELGQLIRCKPGWVTHTGRLYESVTGSTPARHTDRVLCDSEDHVQILDIADGPVLVMAKVALTHSGVEYKLTESEARFVWLFATQALFIHLLRCLI